jgi:uncharacterized protein (TIRG00374 family)
MKRKALLGVAISAISLYVALRGIDWSAVGTALASAQYVYLIPNVALVMFTMWLRAVRWKLMITPLKKGVSLDSLFASTMIGFMVNNILPLRLGELARPFSLSKKEDLSRSAVFATIVVERVFDALSLFLMSGMLVAFAPFLVKDDPLMVRALYGLLGLHGVALAFLVMLRVRTEWALAMIRRVTGFLPARFQDKVLDVTDKFASGLGVFKDWRGLAAIVAWSLIIWALIGFSNWFIFLAFGLEVPWFAPYVLLAFVALGVMLPSAPGFVGPFQFFTIQALLLFGIERSVGLSFSLVLHIGNYVPVTLVGLYYLRREHFSIKQIEEEVA